MKNKIEESVNDALDDLLNTMEEAGSRIEKKKLLMALIITIYEEAYGAANPLPVTITEKMN